MKQFLKEMEEVLIQVRQKKPLIECITNYVTIGDCANIVLAAGASPIMAEDAREMEEIVSMAGAVVLNIGTLQKETVRTMHIAGKAANQLGVPVIFDPVGVGATTLRNETARELLEEVQMTVIRGNLSEIKALSGMKSNTKGVDAADGDVADNSAAQIVNTLSQNLNCCIAATGESDLIASGGRVFLLENGHKMMADVTGTGCMCSCVVGAYCGAGTQNPLAAAAAAVLAMSISGEQAYEFVQKAGAGIGTFREKLFDYVYSFGAKEIEERGKLHELQL